MKKIACLILGVLSFSTLLSQNFSILSVDYIRYFDNIENYKRKNCLSVGYEHEWKINSTLYLKAGIDVIIMQEEFTILTRSDAFPADTITGEIIDTIRNTYTDKGNAIGIGLQIPFYAKINLYQSRLFLLSGFNINVDKLMTFTEYTDTDPEIGSPDGSRSFDIMQWRRLIGIGFNLGLLFELSPRIGFSAEFVTTKNADHSFSFVSLGMKIRLSGIEKY